MTELTATKNRIQSIDILRGIAMVVMALDHVRDYFHYTAMTDDPLNLATTSPALYFTRWITHFCAPVFVFLSGTSAYLIGVRKGKAALSSFLIKRGLWLMLIEVLIITLGWTFNPFYNLIILQVIWAIGISMIILGLMVWLPYWVIFSIGLIIVAGHNLLDYAEAARDHKVGFWWDLVHHAQFSFYPYANNRAVIIVYAFLPWTGVMILGYCLGRLFESTVAESVRIKRLLLLGGSLIVVFILLRFINAYGDPVPWKEQKTGLYTILDFLKVNKYPPSLMFLCIMLGPAIVLLAFFERARGWFANIMKVYGSVPFFYYVLHLYLIHLICVVAFFLSGYTTNDIVSQQSLFLFRPPQFGFSLWGVYGIWLLTIVLLYPMCRWYKKYKSTHHQWWLSYL